MKDKKYFGEFLVFKKSDKLKKKMDKTEEMKKNAKEWNSEIHKEMIAATLMNPSLITLRSLALGIPEIEVRRRLEEELTKDYDLRKGG